MEVNRKTQLSELIVRFDPRWDQVTNPPTSWKLEQRHDARDRDCSPAGPVMGAGRCETAGRVGSCSNKRLGPVPCVCVEFLLNGPNPDLDGKPGHPVNIPAMRALSDASFSG